MKPLVTSFRDVAAATVLGGVTSPAYSEAAYAGSFFYCKSSVAPFQMAFDAGQFFDWDGGYKIANTPFKKIVFANYNLFPIRIYFSVATEAVDFIGTSEQKEAPTIAVGNQGSGFWLTAPTVKKIGGGNWDINSNVMPDLTANNLIYMPGSSNGRRRKFVTFQNGGANSLVVFDELGGLFTLVRNNNVQVCYFTDAAFYAGGHAGDANGMIVSEVFYSN